MDAPVVTPTTAPWGAVPGCGGVPAGAAARLAAPLRRRVARHPTASYLVLAFACAWGVMAPLLLSQRGLGALPLDPPAGAVAGVNALASYVGLLLPAILVAAAADGRAGVRALLRHCFRWRAGRRWYLLALLGLPAAVLVAALPLYSHMIRTRKKTANAAVTLRLSRASGKRASGTLSSLIHPATK